MSPPAVTPDPYAAYGGQVASGAGADPYASYGGKVADAPTSPPPESGTSTFFSHLANSTGLSALAHPIDTITHLPDAAKAMYQNAKTEGSAAIDMAKQGQYAAAAAHAVQAVPIVGQVLKNAGDEISSPQGNGYGTLLANEVKSSAAMGDIVGTALTPAIGEGAGRALKAIVPTAGKVALLGKTPAEAYESALKPSTTLSQADRASIVNTGLDQSIPVSKGGLEKIGDLIDNYNQQIKDTIASDPTRPIDPNAVASRADLAKAKFSQQVNAGGDLDAIDASKRQFLAEQGASTPLVGPQGPAPPMNAADAQAMKQGTYRVLAGKFGEQGSASVEAQKALARGLKEELATQFPEISKLNASESKLLDLQPVLERAVNRTQNHQLIGIGTPIAGAATKAVTGSGALGAVATALKATLDNPMVKSRLAIAISKGGNIPYGQAVGKVAAYSAALSNAANPPSQ